MPNKLHACVEMVLVLLTKICEEYKKNKYEKSENNIKIPKAICKH